MMGDSSGDANRHDGETPRRPVELAGFEIDATTVTNDAFARFVAATDYRTEAEVWGFSAVFHLALSAPADDIMGPAAGTPWWFGVRGADWAHPGGSGTTLDGISDHPVVHVSWNDAQAYCDWAGRRLPTEAEWEKAARYDPVSGRSRRYPWGDDEPEARHANLGGAALRPSPAGSYPQGTSPLGVRQMIGDVWEWVSSDFLPYPAFNAFPYREYSEVLFGSDYKVLRGGSWAVDPAACRATFRNWDYPIRRQIFSGFRTARDARPDEVF